VRTELEDEDIKNGLLGTVQAQKEAIEVAYQRYAKPLAGFIRERVAPTLDSDEVASAVNDTFCALAQYVSRGRFKAEGAVITLLFSMARFKAYDHLRRKTARRRGAQRTNLENEPICDGGLNDDDFANQEVAQRLIAAPEVAALWRTAADEGASNEIIQEFRLWIGGLPRLQRKVAEVLLTNFGDLTNAEISEEIGRTGERPSEASVKSARYEISQKFKTLMEIRERTKGP
jgi:RNA polymerase sigma factor (sigma-70 family)